MIKILFVCHGNICRSPMAEFVMKDLVRKAGLESEFEIASAATSREELGNPVYPPARRKLAEHGIGTDDNELGVSSHIAHQINLTEFNYYDMIVLMDQNNLRNLKRVLRLSSGDLGKVRMLCEGREVADPWYTGNFDQTWDDVLSGCIALLEETETGY